ncbi:MAG: peptidylprolyl isomerase [Azoarcus sp.]|jgi:peptidyl-prolyl cis-trans isomerase C|nr:peptidylprolyl isomerase [Azoarcus sp.]
MKFKLKHLGITFAALSLISIAGCAGDRSPAASGKETKPAAAFVNGIAIPDELIEVIVAEQRAQQPQGAKEDPNMKDSIRKELVRRALLEQDAIKAGINKRPDTLARQNLASQNALIRDYVQDWMKNNAPSDDELKKEYETIKASLGDQKEYHARHILLKTEKDAKNVIGRLQKGAKFADLARSKSLDPGSKDNGGDLGWVTPAAFVPPFSEAMTKLTKSQYSQTPVRTEYGYHVILLEDMRNVEPPDFDTVKPELQQHLQQKKWQEYMTKLEAGAEVK